MPRHGPAACNGRPNRRLRKARKPSALRRIGGSRCCPSTWPQVRRAWAVARHRNGLGQAQPHDRVRGALRSWRASLLRIRMQGRLRAAGRARVRRRHRSVATAGARPLGTAPDLLVNARRLCWLVVIARGTSSERGRMVEFRSTAPPSPQSTLPSEHQLVMARSDRRAAGRRNCRPGCRPNLDPRDGGRRSASRAPCVGLTGRTVKDNPLSSFDGVGNHATC